jgi:hypothetical protein
VTLLSTRAALQYSGAVGYPGIGTRVWELAAVVALGVAYEIADLLGDETATDAMNIAGPIWLAGVMSIAAWRIARGIQDGVWMALFWFRVGTAVYLCAGSLVPIFGSDASRLYLESTFAFQAHHILKFNAIVAWSVLVVLLASSIVDAMLGRANSSIAEARVEGGGQTKAILPVALSFLAIGSILKYFVIVPTQLGWTSVVLPGVVVQLADSMLIALYLLTIWSMASARRYFPFVVVIVVFDMAVGLLLFNKSAVLYPLIVLGLGLLRSGVSRLRVGAIVTAFIVSFSILQPLAAHARIVQHLQFGSPTAGSLEERWQMLSSYFNPSMARVADSEVQVTLIRFTLVNVAAFVIDLHDRGQPGDTLSGALVLLVPRIIWPEKPSFTPGADLAFLIASQEGNSVSAGLFAEAYWNFGWLGIPFLMVPYGAILAILSRFALSVMRGGAWIYLPVLFLALKMGSRVDGLYINDVIGATAIAIGGWLVCRMVVAILGLSVQDNRVK